MKIKTLRIVSCNNAFIAKYRNFKNLFSISPNNTLPSIAEILFSKDILYIFDKASKKQHTFIYFLIKILRKRHTKIHNLQSFFSCNCSSKNIFIAHDTNIDHIIMQNLDVTDIRDLTFYILDIMETTQKSEPKKYKNIYKRLLSTGKFEVNNDFTGRIVISNRVNSDFITLVSMKFPNAKSINIKLFDYLNNTPHSKDSSFISELNKSRLINKVSIFTYSLIDARSYDLNYEPNGVNITKLAQIRKKESIKYDVFFAGNASGKRFPKLLKLIQKFESAGLRYKLILAYLNSAEKEEILKINISQGSEISFTAVSYDAMLLLSSQSTAIIDLYRISPDEGYSFRIGEAIGLNCKVITDRSLLIQETFYDRNNFLVNKDLSFSEKELTIFLKESLCQYSHETQAIFDIKRQSICK